MYFNLQMRKKDCDIANITTCDESEESSGDEVPLGKRIPKKKSFGTEFATGIIKKIDFHLGKSLHLFAFI